MAFEKLFRLSEMPTTSGRRAYLSDGREVALFVLDGNLVAVDNICPHQRFALLHEGEVVDGSVVCPMHGWEFDLKSGQCRVGGEATLSTFSVEVRDGVIWIDPGDGEELGWANSC